MIAEIEALFAVVEFVLSFTNTFTKLFACLPKIVLKTCG